MSNRPDRYKHLTEEEWIIFCNQYINDYKKSQKALNDARHARDSANELIKSYLESINRTKISTMELGIKLDD